MDMDEALQVFIVESRELLESMENALLNVGHEVDPAEAINAIFRCAHTIKGSAGLFGLDHIVGFTHVVESVLDEVRDGAVTLEEALVVLLLSCCDHLLGMTDALAEGQLDADPDTERAGAQLLAQLHAFLPAATGSGVVALHAEVELERIQAQDMDSDLWHISVRFGPLVLQNGMDPLSFLRYLSTIGRIAGIVPVFDTMPEADEMDPEQCYLGFEIAFDSKAERAAIEGVFEFVREDCTLHILAPHSRIEEYVKLIGMQPGGGARLGEILVRCGSVTQHELETALARQAGGGAAPLGEILVAGGTVPPVVVEAALARQKHVHEQRAQENRSVRVDADKLDLLINLVGELIIAGARIGAIGQKLGSLPLQEATSSLSGLVEDVRDAALELRMVKIGATFNRFQRVVHDVSREVGKDIGLLVLGEDAELDKTVVEKIGDPLMHLVRNAIDHGIEASAVRVQNGKPARGHVTLNAYHDSGSIVIEVKDDGGGLRKERILAKAIERGLVDPDRKLSDSEIFQLVFEPGFSTADQVTNLSGRGVGMDVVKRNIVALRGSVAIDSEEGVGTTVSVRLPLTLAIINGFQVQLGASVFVVPLDSVEECIELASEPGHDYTNLRGQVLPLVSLRELFGIEGARTRRESVVVVSYAGQRAGLIVDTLLGEFQTVIKPLGPMFAGARCVSGSTILGSGEVALIVDVAALFDKLTRHGPAQLAA